MKTITNEQRRDIYILAMDELKLLKTQSALAKKLGVSDGTISANLMNESNWESITPDRWIDFGKRLGYRFSGTEWKLAEISNTKTMFDAMKYSQEHSLFTGISASAGSGKSVSIKSYKSQNKNSVVSLECKKWTLSVFLLKLAQEVGISFEGRKLKAWQMQEEIIGFFQRKAKNCKPLLILDQADKLSPDAFRFIIDMYNDTEGDCGLVISGTEFLEKKIKNGVRKQIEGFDEIDSRMTRKYINLRGASKVDVEAICKKNGVVLDADIKHIWDDTDKIYMGETLICKDLRRLKKVIQKHQIKQENNASS